MKKLVLILIGVAVSFLVAGQVKFDNTTPQTAMKYYEAREFTKAAPLFKSIYSVTGNIYYFGLYIQCLSELQDFETAENEIKKEIRKSRGQQPELLIQYGYILGLQKRTEEARQQFTEAIRITPLNKNSVINTANFFLQYREYENAEKMYLKAEKALPGENFTLELAQIHLLLRNYGQLMEELLDAVKISEEYLPRVESLLSSALYLDIDNNLREEFRMALMKRIQAEPGVIGFNRLLIWFYLQEGQFPAALRQSIALDKRTNRENLQILSFAQMALNNQYYEDASAAYNYILSKERDNTVFFQASFNKIHAEYLSFINKEPLDKIRGNQLADEFDKGLALLGYNANTFVLIREYSHLLSYYLGNNEKAIEILEKGLKIPVMKAELWGELKTELADVYINAGDPWEATLLYSQVIEANRDNALGDEVKLKKARLGYYMGNFDWAKAQLDVLKASTSKLTANDAMELSLFISNNSNLDSIEKPLQYFARADLFFFLNKDEQAVVTLDSIESLFPSDLLIDDILFRKAKIEMRRNQDQEALNLLDRIVKDYSWDLLADDALFLKAEIFQYRIRDKEKAVEAYKQILFDFSGSIYVSEARKRFRALSGSSGENEPVPSGNPDNLLFNEKSLRQN
jgi:tetratricopeptide (TPR) repeat protein